MPEGGEIGAEDLGFGVGVGDVAIAVLAFFTVKGCCGVGRQYT